MTHRPNDRGLKVAVVIGATSKWQADGRNTKFVHGHEISDDDVPVTARWGIGGAIAQKFALEGFFTVLTTRNAPNAAGLASAIRDQGGECLVVELNLAAPESIRAAFETIRRDAGDPDVVIYNAGYMEGRTLPPEQELLEHFPDEMFEVTIDVSCRGPFYVAKEILPAMRRKGSGSFFFSNNASSLRGRRRPTGSSLYYPRVMVRQLSQVLTEEYSAHGIHVANVIIDGSIDSPGIRGHAQYRELTMDPARIAEAFWYLHSQDRDCWSHELQLTPSARAPSF